jgi:hypothetical protein
MYINVTKACIFNTRLNRNIVCMKYVSDDMQRPIYHLVFYKV